MVVDGDAGRRRVLAAVGAKLGCAVRVRGGGAIIDQVSLSGCACVFVLMCVRARSRVPPHSPFFPLTLLSFHSYSFLSTHALALCKALVAAPSFRLPPPEPPHTRTLAFRLQPLCQHDLTDSSKHVLTRTHPRARLAEGLAGGGLGTRERAGLATVEAMLAAALRLPRCCARKERGRTPARASVRWHVTISTGMR